MTAIRLWLAAWCGSAGAAVALAGNMTIPPLPTAAALAEARSFAADEYVVAAHYFYWYRWPDEHFFENGSDILRLHFPRHRHVNYESVAWHRWQMQDFNAAGIDVALLIYWGAPNNYEAPPVRFSVHGIPPLVEALDQLAKEGKAPRIAMFYDTSTLLAGHAFAEPRAQNVDLRTAEGKDIFYRTIRDFFCLVPPRHWACIDGRPIVQLYESAFAAGHDQGTIEYVYEQFAKDFHGIRPFVITGPAWSFKADAQTGWGAALGGPIVGDGFVQIGPGYDDSPVPGRTTPTRDRLGGGFYAASWLLALQHQPRCVIIETWNEMHEGTPICESLEDGRMYIDLTRKFSDLFKQGRSPGGDEWASCVQALLGARASQRTGREFASRRELTLYVKIGQNGEPEGMVEDGVRLCPGIADGAYEITTINGVTCVQTRRSITEHRYLYFDIADPYYYDHRGELTVSIMYLDTGDHDIALQYDSTEQTGTIADLYRELPQRITRKNTNTLETVTLKLPGARCANRQNGGADFRLVSLDDDMAICIVTVSKLPENYGKTTRIDEVR